MPAEGAEIRNLSPPPAHLFPLPFPVLVSPSLSLLYVSCKLPLSESQFASREFYYRCLTMMCSSAEANGTTNSQAVVFNVPRFQDSKTHSNGSSGVGITSSLAAKTHLEGDLLTTFPSMQVVRNGTFLLAENQTRNYILPLIPVVNNTAPYEYKALPVNPVINNTASYEYNTQSHQDQCWETYVGQVCSCLGMAFHLLVLP